MRILPLILLIFLVFGGFLIVRYNNYKLDNPDEAVSFTKDYTKWLFGVGKSVTNVVGAAVSETWLPDNDTFAGKESSEKNISNKSDSPNEPEHGVKIIYE